MKPNKRNIRKWVKALRSGDYEQATGTLAEVGWDDGVIRRCCLGVACEISGLVPLRIELDDYDDDDPEEALNNLECHYLRYGIESGTLPTEVQQWLGFTGDDKDNPMVAGDYLSGWNDGRGADFNKIADLIEAEYLS